MTESNIWVNPTKPYEWWVTDLEKPNNEGFCQTAKYGGIAAFGTKEPGNSDAPWKWQHNIKTGLEEVEKLFQKYAPEKVEA